MNERHFYRFPSVDFFGKSMPGLLFALLGVLFLSKDLLTTVVPLINEVTLAIVISVFFVILVVGFTAGQAINTAAIILQRIMYTTGYVVSEFCRDHGAPDYEFWAATELDDSTDDERKVLDTVKYWLWTRYLNSKRGLVPHRVLFNDWVRRHLSADRPPSQDQPKISVLIDKYAEYAKELGGDAPQFPTDGSNEHINDIDVPEDIYLVVADYVMHNGPSRARRHKSLFVFCQNTALVFLLYGVLATLVVVDVSLGGVWVLSDTVLAELLYSHRLKTYYAVPTLFLASFVLFTYAIGVYKKLYLEYLIADFINMRTAAETAATTRQQATKTAVGDD